MPRETNDIIDTALDLMSGLLAPDNFKLWTIISVISSLLARRCWMPNDVGLPPAYPNLYILLVGEPASGKDVSIGFGTNLLIEAQKLAEPRRIITLGAQSISPKGIYDMLGPEGNATQNFTYNRKPHVFNSVTFHIPELSTTMVDYNPLLVGVWNELYNCNPILRDTIRGRDIKINNPHACLLLGNQPDTLFDVLPEKSFGMGLTSRIMFIQCFHETRGVLFTDEPRDVSAIYQKLVVDLHDVSLITGPFEPTREVKRYLNEFALDRPDWVKGRKWKNYNGRRPLHLQKLCMICAASERSNKIVEMRHLDRAYDFLTGYEKELPRLFENVISSRGYIEVFEQIDSFLANKKKIKHRDLTRELARTRNIVEVDRLIIDCLKGGLLEIEKDTSFDPPIEKRPRTYLVRKT